ncbi:hypothetical protein BC937DRAFT_95587 [Endogone sp. FLAS-F59071]|nr:hypothetical protein BC937DRAFT_95587 [Endogone sp. FLAS-F59071]|eukprot:RUS20260.1 hypothetical protein BC937DRAFT_95587 [Endogone sp. FLAS-F59071]
MPFFFIALYDDVLQLLPGTLKKQTFRVEDELYWENFEVFMANYDAFRTNLLIDYGEEQTTLSKLYPGALGRPETKNIVVKLKKLSVFHAQGRFPITSSIDKYNAKEIEWKKLGVSVINGQSVQFGDF